MIIIQMNAKLFICLNKNGLNYKNTEQIRTARKYAFPEALKHNLFVFLLKLINYITHNN